MAYAFGLLADLVCLFVVLCVMCQVCEIIEIIICVNVYPLCQPSQFLIPLTVP